VTPCPLPVGHALCIAFPGGLAIPVCSGRRILRDTPALGIVPAQFHLGGRIDDAAVRCFVEVAKVLQVKTIAEFVDRQDG
jgi:hypothetical protein